MFKTSILALVAMMLTVAGCGGSSSSSSSSSPSSTTATAPAQSSSSASSTPTTAPASAAAGQVLALAADPGGQLKFDTTVLTAKAGKVTINLTNAAPIPHNLTIQSSAEGPVVAATPTFSGGTRSASATLKPGTYTFFCSVPGHRQAGMVGTLTVK